MWRWMRIEDHELFHRNDRCFTKFKVIYKLISQLSSQLVAPTKNIDTAYVLCRKHSGLAIGGATRYCDEIWIFA